MNMFLVANKRLYKRLCPSVCRSVGPWVGRSRVSEFKPKSDLTSINAPAQRSRLIRRVYELVFKDIKLQTFDTADVARGDGDGGGGGNCGGGGDGVGRGGGVGGSGDGVGGGGGGGVGGIL